MGAAAKFYEARFGSPEARSLTLVRVVSGARPGCPHSAGQSVAMFVTSVLLFRTAGEYMNV